MLYLGNGGDGPPHYKLLDLKSSIKLSLDFANDEDFLAKKFPLENYLVWEGVKLSEQENEKRNKIYMGNLILGEDGCAMYWSLIVSGTQKGQIWQFTEVGVQPCAPKLTFLDWYEYWLDGGDDWWRDFYL